MNRFLIAFLPFPSSNHLKENGGIPHFRNKNGSIDQKLFYSRNLLQIGKAKSFAFLNLLRPFVSLSKAIKM